MAIKSCLEAMQVNQVDVYTVVKTIIHIMQALDWRISGSSRGLAVRQQISDQPAVGMH